MRFVAAMVTAPIYTSTLTSKIALFRIGYPVGCFDTQTLSETLFIYPLLFFCWKQPPRSDPNRGVISKYLLNRGSWYPASNANTTEQAQIDLQKENFHRSVLLFARSPWFASGSREVPLVFSPVIRIRPSVSVVA